ncbi:MAG: ABC transporter ATP-binding protein [Nonlabens sp.]
MLQIHNLQIGYGDQVVAGFEGDYAFAKAELTAIIGANGAGKSTLLRAIATGEHLIEGKIMLHGKNRASYGGDLARELAVVRTDRTFSHYLSVIEMLELSRTPYTSIAGKLKQKDHEIVENCLHEFDLKRLARKRLGNLSDGQLQRVLVARAIVQDTPLVLMDEPTSHLDINHKTDLLLQLKSYCERNHKCVLFATHELELALSLADHVVAIHDKQITYQDVAAFKRENLLDTMFPSRHISFVDGRVRFTF